MFKEMKEVLDNGNSNISITENGAIGFKTTGNEMVDVTFKLSSYRTSKKNEVKYDLLKVFNSINNLEDRILFARWLFYVRDIREGLGERNFFRIGFPMLLSFYKDEKDIAKNLLSLVPEYSRWDDLIYFLDNEDTENCEEEILNLIKSQFELDKVNMKKGKPISLLAKWLPNATINSKKIKNIQKTIISQNLKKSEINEKELLNFKFDDKKIKNKQYHNAKKARKIAKYLGLNEKEYRKTVSEMRKYIDIVEIHMTEKSYEDIKYDKVPSRANLIYKNAFMRNDKENYEKYLEDVKSGKKDMNAKDLFPHEIVSKYCDGYCRMISLKDDTLEELWKKLPRNLRKDEEMLIVRDGSYSMHGYPLNIADALTLFISEQLKGEFHGRFITFSEHPQLIDMSNMDDYSLKDKLNFLKQYDDCSNTNIEGVFDLILETAIKNHLKQEEIPQRILIISDMEFDEANSTVNCYYDSDEIKDRKYTTLFSSIEKKWKKEGYHFPKLCFWNVTSRTCTIPVKESPYGVSLISGFSPNILSMVISNELDPLKQLIETVSVERYNAIEELLRSK